MATFHTAIYSADIPGTSHIPCIQEATVHRQHKNSTKLYCSSICGPLQGKGFSKNEIMSG